LPAIARLSLVALLALGASGAAQAASAIGLVNSNTLVMFDTEARTVTGTMTVTGVDGLAGIDIRPADSMLYGVTLAGEVVTIDMASGAATVQSTLSEKLPSYEGAIVDFNPMADRLRLMGTDGTNHRVNVDDGAVTVDGSLAFQDGDMHVGETPAIVAAAYTNSIGKPEATSTPPLSVSSSRCRPMTARWAPSACSASRAARPMPSTSRPQKT
jgi:hypothetical protein